MVIQPPRPITFSLELEPGGRREDVDLLSHSWWLLCSQQPWASGCQRSIFLMLLLFPVLTMLMDSNSFHSF